MQSKITWFWNLVYYYFLKLSIQLWNIIFYPLRKIAHLIKGQSYSWEEISEVSEPYSAQSKRMHRARVQAGAKLSLLIMLLELAFFIFTQHFLLGRYFSNYMFHHRILVLVVLIIVIAILLWINQACLYKDKRYVTYCNEFDQMSSQDKTKYGWIVFLFVLAILLILVLSFT